MKWFVFGFIICIIGICVALIQILHAITKSTAISFAIKIVSCPFGCGGLAWLIAGMVLRWRHVG